MPFRNAFTLIELLVVIAIIAILSIVVVLVLNPAELLRQSRDSNRLSDLATMATAFSVYSAQGGTSYGSSSVVYVSIADPTATSTAGDQCQGLGLISLPATYSYHCAASSTLRNVNGTGWIPVNFTTLAGGSPVGQLPQDPLNSSSSRLYFTYTTNGSQYEMTSVLESQKYGLGGSNDAISGDGGSLASVYEKGTGLGLEPLDYGDNSLVGYWTLDEGTSSIAYDYSGNNATGSWQGTLGSQWATGKIGSGAGNLNGSNNYIGIGSPTINPTTAFSLIAWVDLSSPSCGASSQCAFMGNGNYQVYGLDFGLYARNYLTLQMNQSGGGSSVGAVSNPLSVNTWTQVAVTFNGALSTLYENGTLITATSTVAPVTSAVSFTLGSTPQGGWGKFFGLLDDVRIYNRALSATQISAMYAGGK